jgi:uncharacterized membrane protein
MDTSYGRVLRWPNAALGVAWYTVAACAGGLMLARGEVPMCAAFVLAAVVAVLVSVYLAWALVVKLRTFCLFCSVGYACNAALLALLLAGC